VLFIGELARTSALASNLASQVDFARHHFYPEVISNPSFGPKVAKFVAAAAFSTLWAAKLSFLNFPAHGFTSLITFILR